MHRELVERNIKIAVSVLKGQLYKDAAQEHNIIPDRVRQILFKVCRKLNYDAMKRMAKEVDSYHYLKWMREHRDMFLQKIVEEIEKP